MKISVVIHTKNSSKTMGSTLESVKWADEIVVIDGISSDSTQEIAAQYNAKIFEYKNMDYVELARNFGIGKAKGDWILIVDADEEIPATLHEKLIELTALDTDAWKLPRKNLMFGQWVHYAGWWPDYNIRFFKKGTVDWPTKIHSQPKVTGSVGILDPKEEYAIIHHNYTDIDSFIGRLNKYTSITVAEGTKLNDSAFEQFFDEFFSRFFAREGYKDKTLGLHLSMLQSMYQAVARIKQWEKQGYKQVKIDPATMMTKLISELAYWRADYMVKETNSFWWKLRRKFRI